MSKKRCIRKVYAKINPIHYVMESIKPVNQASVDKLLTRELSSLEAMAKGSGTLQEWTDLNDVLSLCETMARNGIGNEALDACKTLQADLIAAAKRYEQTKRMGMTATGIQAARDVIEYHNLQRTSITLIEYEKQIKITTQRRNSRSPEVVEI